MIKKIHYSIIFAISFSYASVEPLDMVTSNGVCGSNISNPDMMSTSYDCVVSTSKALMYPSSDSKSYYEMMTIGSDSIPNLSSNLFTSQQSTSDSSSSSTTSTDSSTTSSDSSTSSSTSTSTSPAGF